MSLVLYGPPGTGKTTLAHVISLATKRQFVQLSALDSGVKEVRAVITAAKRELTYAGRRTVLFIDEVHRFSKTQQDSLLSRGRGPDRQPDRRDHREPVLLRRQPAAVPQPRAGPAAAQRRRHPRRARAARSPASAASTAPSPSPRRPRTHLLRVAGGDARKALTALESGAGAARRGRHRRPRPGDPGDRGRPGRRPLRPAGRPALRRRQRADQEHPGQRRRRRAALPGPDGRGGGGPAVHRPPAGHLRQRGHRHGRPDGAAHRGRRRRRGRLHRHARGALPAGAGRRAPGHGAEVQRGHRRPWASPSPTCAPGWPARCRPACATPTTPGRRSSATARPTTTRTPTPTASCRSSTRPTRWSGKDYYRPDQPRASRARLAERLAKLRAIIRRTPLSRPPDRTDDRSGPATTVTTPGRRRAGRDDARDEEQETPRVRRRVGRADRSPRLGAAGGAARHPPAQARAHARRDDADHPAGARAEPRRSSARRPRRSRT